MHQAANLAACTRGSEPLTFVYYPFEKALAEATGRGISRFDDESAPCSVFEA
jgi:hypothetical protein